MFDNAGIKIIRVGLHSGGNVEEEYAGGAYHPALRELCEGRIYYNNALSLLEKNSKGSYILNVNPRELSKMTGQKKENLLKLREKGYVCAVKGVDGLKKYEVDIIKEVVR